MIYREIHEFAQGPLPRVIAGEYAATRSIYVDPEGATVVVPEGWTVSGSPKENKISNGLIIYLIPRDEVNSINWMEFFDLEKAKSSYSQCVWILDNYKGYYVSRYPISRVRHEFRSIRTNSFLTYLPTYEAKGFCEDFFFSPYIRSELCTGHRLNKFLTWFFEQEDSKKFINLPKKVKGSNVVPFFFATISV